MMISPNCPDHDRLVLDLALGLLDDETAAEAEAVGESCPVCRAWWHEQFEVESTQVVDQAVAAAFDDLQLPVRRRRHGWLAAAAAVVMALGVGTLWVSQRSLPVDEALSVQTASIQTLDFENLEADGEFIMVEAAGFDLAPAEQVVAERSIAEEDSGAGAAPAVETGEAAEAFFSGGFENGNLGAWVPST